MTIVSKLCCQADLYLVCRISVPAIGAYKSLQLDQLHAVSEKQKVEQGISHHPNTVASVEIGEFLAVKDLFPEQASDLRIVLGRS